MSKTLVISTIITGGLALIMGLLVGHLLGWLGVNEWTQGFATGGVIMIILRDM